MSIYRALIVEDEPANQDFLVRLVSQAGFEVQGASSAAQALQLAEDNLDLTLVAVDLQLPDMPGLTLVKKLRAVLPDCLIIVATMWDEPGLIESAFENGCDVFLVKPHGFMELYNRLRTMPDSRPQLSRLLIDQYGPRPYGS